MSLAVQPPDLIAPVTRGYNLDLVFFWTDLLSIFLISISTLLVWNLNFSFYNY